MISRHSTGRHGVPCSRGKPTLWFATWANRQILNTRAPWQTELPRSGDPPPAPDLVERGEPWVSDLFKGALANAPLYSVNLPVVLADGRKLVLNMSAPTASLMPILRQSGLPPLGKRGSRTAAIASLSALKTRIATSEARWRLKP